MSDTKMITLKSFLLSHGIQPDHFTKLVNNAHINGIDKFFGMTHQTDWLSCAFDWMNNDDCIKWVKIDDLWSEHIKGVSDEMIKPGFDKQ